MNIFCIGRNYVEHAKELGNEIPEEPVIFIKPHTALLKHGALFHYPSFTKDLHYECELVLKISKQGKNIAESDARGYYDQITLGIDFTARDVQNELKDLDSIANQNISDEQLNQKFYLKEKLIDIEVSSGSSNIKYF